MTKFGLMTGVVISALLAAPKPWGPVVMWSAISVQGAIGAWIVWRRLRLLIFCLGGLAGLIASVGMVAVSARGLDLVSMARILPLPVVAVIWLSLLLSLTAIGFEAFRDRPEWRELKRRVATATSLDFLLFRHIPHVHDAPRGSERSTALTSFQMR